jgi:hypothetical protein
MTEENLSDIIKNLRYPFGKAITQNAMLRPKGGLHGLAQIITGPRRSGKTTEALGYAAALAKAGLVDAKAPVMADGGLQRDPAAWRSVFNSAEKGVLIIDDIYKNSTGTQSDALSDLLFLAFINPTCVLILTGDKEPMDDYLKEIRSVLCVHLPRVIKTDKSFSEEEIFQYHQKNAEQKRLEKEVEKGKRTAAEWLLLSEDVTLKRAIKPMKGIVLLRKNDTVT